MIQTIGGTLAARICGVSRYGGPLSAYFEIVDGDDGVDHKTASIWLNRGKALEESVLALWAERMGGVDWAPGRGAGRVQPSFDQDMAYAHATLDALARWTEEGVSGWRVLDAKTANIHEMGEDWGLDGSDQVPAEYQVQLLWYLGVCKAAGMHVADEALLPTLCGPEAELQWAVRLVQAAGRPLRLADLEGTALELRCYRVEWDEALFQALNERVVAFLREHVEPRWPPEPGPGDLLERDLRSVAKGLKAEPGRVLDFEHLPSSEQALVLELLDANRQRKAWAEREDQAAGRVKLAMATAEEVRGLPGGAWVTWKERQTGVRVFQVKEPRR